MAWETANGRTRILKLLLQNFLKMSQIAPILSALLSPVNDTRRAAEKAYAEALKSNPSAVRDDASLGL